MQLKFCKAYYKINHLQLQFHYFNGVFVQMMFMFPPPFFIFRILRPKKQLTRYMACSRQLLCTSSSKTTLLVIKLYLLHNFINKNCAYIFFRILNCKKTHILLSYLELPATKDLKAEIKPSTITDYQRLLLLGAEAFLRIKNPTFAKKFLDLAALKNVKESDQYYLVKIPEGISLIDKYYN